MQLGRASRREHVMRHNNSFYSGREAERALGEDSPFQDRFASYLLPQSSPDVCLPPPPNNAVYFSSQSMVLEKSRLQERETTAHLTSTTKSSKLHACILDLSLLLTYTAQALPAFKTVFPNSANQHTQGNHLQTCPKANLI